MSYSGWKSIAQPRRAALRPRTGPFESAMLVKALSGSRSNTRPSQRRKSGGSKTVTMKKKKPPVNTHIYNHGECSFSYFKHKDHRLSPAVWGVQKDLSKKIYNYIESGRVVVADGTRDVRNLPDGGAPIMGQGDLNACMAMSFIGTSGTATATPSKNSKFVCLGAKGNIALSNLGESMIKFTVWDLMKKRDGTELASTQMAMGIHRVSGDGSVYTNIDQSPYHSPEWKLNNKVLGKASFCLMPGQSHYHNYLLDYAKIWDNTLTDSSPNTIYKGWTYEPMVQAQGSLSYNGTTANNVSTADCVYIWSLKREIGAKFLPEMNNAGSLFNQSAIIAKGTMSGGKVVNTDTGVIETVDNPN